MATPKVINVSSGKPTVFGGKLNCHMPLYVLVSFEDKYHSVDYQNQGSNISSSKPF